MAQSGLRIEADALVSGGTGCGGGGASRELFKLSRWCLPTGRIGSEVVQRVLHFTPLLCAICFAM